MQDIIENYMPLLNFLSTDYKDNKIFQKSCWGSWAPAFKLNTDSVCFTELPASILLWTLK